MPPPRTRALALVSLPALALWACTVGPNYKRPPVVTPPAFKEAEGWARAAPADVFDRGPWWLLFGDPVLDRLEPEVAAHNQTLIAAEQAYSQARALTAEARASFFPTVTLDPNFIEFGGGGLSSSFGLGFSGAGLSSSLGQSGLSSGLGAGAGAATTTTTTFPKTLRIYELTLGETWAPDVWGKVRRQVESAGATAQASAANVANVRLTLQTELASDYLQLRATDEALRLYDQTVKDFQLTLTVIKTQYNVGTAAQDAIDQAAAQLFAAQAEGAALQQSRQQFEHAVAVLIGRPPATFSLPAKPFDPKVPNVPAGTPTALLQRRPDIAQAERQMKAANAEIGVAVSAYFPDLTLTGNSGLAGSELSGLISASHVLWSFGASAPETVFQGGFRGAAVKAAKASYRQTVAAYRQTVLTAFQQVEDELIALRMLAREEDRDRKAWIAAADVERIVTNQYRIGTASITDVLTAQQNALTARRTLVAVQGQRLVAAVTLIEALGGGWTARDLPKP
jgi:NodT family efflux transporter outer membrane factor (OMF) lipoprotein